MMPHGGIRPDDVLINLNGFCFKGWNNEKITGYKVFLSRILSFNVYSWVFTVSVLIELVSKLIVYESFIANADTKLFPMSYIRLDYFYLYTAIKF